MATFGDFIDALEEAMSPESSTKPEKSARKPGAITASASNLSRNVEPSQAGVMTDVGPANARAYSAILSGQQRSRQAESQTPVLAAPAGSLISSHIVDLANPVEMAASGPTGHGYPSILATPPGGAESQIATPEGFSQYPAIMAGAGEPPAQASISSLTPEAAPPLPPSLVSQVATGQSAAGTVRRQPSITVSPPSATQRTVTAPLGGPVPESPAVSTGFPTGPAGRGYPSILAAPPGPTGSHVASARETSPAAVPPAPAIPEEPLRLTEALKRLTEAVTEARRREERTVAQDIKGLSWAERRERLKRSGNLLSEEAVQQTTLKREVTQRDIVRESERHEQRQRDRRQEGLGNAVKGARYSVVQSVEKSVGGIFSRVIGRRAGTAIGQTAGRMASRFLGRTAAGGAAAGAAVGAVGSGLGGAVSRMGALALNPYVALGVAAAAATVALLKLPSSSQRLAKSFLDSQRKLAAYSAPMQALFARMDYQKRVLSSQQAQATGGTTTLLGDELMKLRTETQWAREGFTSIKNLFATSMVLAGQVVNALFLLIPGLKDAVENLKKLDESLAGPKPPDVIDFLQGFGAEYKRDRPRNRKPDRDDQSHIEGDAP